MDLTSKKTIKELLQKYNVKPSRGLGQNFLVCGPVLNKVFESAKISQKDVVLEVGPGIGTLTKELAERAGRVIAIEKDPKMVEILREVLGDYKNVEVIKGDILKMNLSLAPLLRPSTNFYKNSAGKAISVSNSLVISENYKVVANIPYYITAPLIRQFLETKNPPQEMVLIVQKEVAQRITASPPNMSLLAVAVQFYAQPKIISYVKKECFWPKPKVDSAIIKIIPRESPAFARMPGFRANFFNIVRAGFSQPRKQLANNLSRALKKDPPLLKAQGGPNKKQVENWLLKNNINPSQRAQTLSVEDWINLTINPTINPTVNPTINLAKS